MSECYGFNNPIVIESDVYFALRQEVEAYRKAISNLEWQIERRHQYLRSCNKVDLEPDEDIRGRARWRHIRCSDELD